MNYLVYVSQAKRPFSPEALKTLLEHSRDRNEADGITGLLIYRYVPEANRGNFLQILEGEPAALDDVWGRISEDERHHSIVVLEEDTAPERMFANWTMGFRDVETDDLSGFEGYSDLGSDKFWNRVKENAVPGALDLLRSFYDPA